MRVLRRAIWALLMIVALAPAAASAAGTVALDTKPDVIPYDAATTVKVSYTGDCQDMLQDTDAGQQPTTIQIATESTASGTPNPWLQISSTTMPWGTQDQVTGCLPPGKVTTSGTVTITPTIDAPALTPSTVKLTIKGPQSTSGTPGSTFDVKVAYHGSLNASSDKTELTAGLDQKKQFNLTLDIFTNGKGTVVVTQDQPVKLGKVDGLGDTIDIAPPGAYMMTHPGMGPMWMEGGPGAGKPQSQFVPITYHSSATPWTTPDTLKLTLVLKSADDPTMSSAPVSLQWTFSPDPTAMSTKSGKSPGPELGLVLMLGAALALVMRRRDA